MAMAQPVDVNIRMNGIDNASAAMGRVSREVKNLRNQMGRSNGVLVRNRRLVQQVGFQVSDFATQVAGGQSAMLAFTQQGGQLLQFFGPFGAALAGAVAVFGSLAIAITRSGKSLGDLKGLAGALTPAFQAFGTALHNVKEGMIDFANLIVNNLDRLLVIAGTVTFFFATQWVASFIAARVVTFSLVGALMTLRAALIRLGIGAVLVAIGELVYRMIALSEAMGSGAEASKLMGDVFREVIDRMRVTMGTFLEWLGDVWYMLVVADFKDAMNEIKREWADMLYGLADALYVLPGFDETARKLAMASQRITGEVNKAGVAIQNLRNDFESIWGGPSDILGKFADIWDQPIESLEKMREILKKAKIDLRDWFGGGSADSGGGGAGAIADAMKNLQSLADSVGDSIANAFRNGKNAADIFKNALKGVIEKLYDVLVVQQIVGNFDAKTGTGTGIMGFLGPLLGGLTSFAGGGYTGAGVRAGGVDGKGGFPAILHPNETIVDHSASSGQSSGNGSMPSIVVNQTISVAPGDNRSAVRAEVLRMMPQIQEGTKSAVLEAALRGGTFKSGFR